MKIFFFLSFKKKSHEIGSRICFGLQEVLQRNKPAVLGKNYQTKINKNSLKKTDW